MARTHNWEAGNIYFAYRKDYLWSHEATHPSETGQLKSYDCSKAFISTLLFRNYQDEEFISHQFAVWPLILLHRKRLNRKKRRGVSLLSGLRRKFFGNTKNGEKETKSSSLARRKL